VWVIPTIFYFSVVFNNNISCLLKKSIKKIPKKIRVDIYVGKCYVKKIDSVAFNNIFYISPFSDFGLEGDMIHVT
jgi:hypothetical protein